MYRFAGVTAALIAMLSVAWTAQAMPGSNHAAAAPAVNCGAVTFALQPGLGYPPGRADSPTPPDAPRVPHTVSLPLYPGAVPLTHDVATPFPEASADPYLQTASAEYEGIDTGAGGCAAKDWRTVVPRCFAGPEPVEPIWLDFVRRDGSIVPAYETMWGQCNGLAVNRIGWLIDTGTVWHQAIALLRGRG